MIARLLTAVMAALTLGTGAAAAAPAHTAHLEAELVPMTTAAAPGQTVYVALRQRIAPGWHTYWRNSGDAGQPTQIGWTLPAGWKAGDIVWATPKRLPEANLMTYGYEGEVLLPVPLKVPATARPGTTAQLTAQVDYLVCKDLCVPESARLSLDLPVATTSNLAPGTGPAVSQALRSAPQPAGLTAGAVRRDGLLELGVAGPALKGVDAAGAYFFPYDPKLILHPARQAVERGREGLTLTLSLRPEVKTLDRPIRGVLATRAGAFEIEAKPGPLPAGARGLGPAASAGEGPPKPAHVAGADLSRLPGALLLGLAGGLVLNLMPCVFPVLAMKAAALARGAERPAEARVHGLAYLAGTLTTFLALAGLILAAKAAGHAVGWGFQLQSPWVTGTLALLMLAVALNLSGVFEIGLAAQRAGSSLAAHAGAAGAFLTGALTVVIAAPCTAPFMAAAVGYALTAGPLPALAVFAALGVGLGLPFAALSFSPALLRALPKPGAWMATLQRLLAFPMYGTAAWMAWVFAQQTAPSSLGLLFSAGVALALALHLLGRAQQADIQGRRALASLAGAGLATTLAVFLGAWGAGAAPVAAGAPAPAAEVASEPFTPARLAQLRAEGRPVFVNFTAAWCVTCKVNERAALSSKAVAEAFDRSGAAYLVGDWTRGDPAVSSALAEQGRSGVPLYLVYKPGAAQPVVLPQLLTEDAVVKALKSSAT